MKRKRSSCRIGEQVRERLASILLLEIADPRLEFVTVTGCDVSSDRSFVRGYTSCEKGRYDAVLGALNHAKGRIRSLLGTALNWRTTPEITFVIDTTIDEAERIERILLENVPPMLEVEKDEHGYPLNAVVTASYEEKAGKPSGVSGDVADQHSIDLSDTCVYEKREA